MRRFASTFALLLASVTVSSAFASAFADEPEAPLAPNPYAAPAPAPAAQDPRTGAYFCAPNTPASEVLTCVPAPAGTALPLAAPAFRIPTAPAPTPVPVVQLPDPQAAPRTLRGRTHDFFAPTGELVPSGDVELRATELGLYNEVAIGVSDNFELNAGAPIVPSVATIGARVGLLPRESPYRLTLGAGLAIPVIGDAHGVLLMTSATAAYQSDRFNLHGTLAVWDWTDPSGNSNSEGIVIASAGVTAMVSDKVALTADVGDFEALHQSSSQTGCGDCSMSSSSSDTGIQGAMIGLKLMGQNFDTDLGFIVPLGRLAEGGEMPALPIVSFTYRY